MTEEQIEEAAIKAADRQYNKQLEPGRWNDVVVAWRKGYSEACKEYQTKADEWDNWCKLLENDQILACKIIKHQMGI